MTIKTFAQATERLAEAFPGYEARSHQVALAEAIEKSLESGTHLLGQAGTGTGKSFAHLIPAILSGKRTIVSTATKALQDQLASKDLPWLHEHLGIDFTFAILKGRSNYVCLNRVIEADIDQSTKDTIISVIQDKGGDLALGLDADEGFTGEQDQFGIQIDWRDWSQVSSDSDECKECGFECFAYRARQRALDSHIVVVNHALYLTELLVKDVTDGNVSFLGPHAIFVADEFHEFEEYASSSLGGQLRHRGITNLMRQVENVTLQYDQERSRQVGQLTSEVEKAADDLWNTLEDGRITSTKLIDHADQFVGLTNALIDLEEFLGEKWPKTTMETSKKKGARARRLVASMVDTMVTVVQSSFNDYVRWVETETTRRTRETSKVLNYAPIEVGPYLRRLLFDEENGVTVIGVSATLTVNNKFDYIAGRLGLDHYDSIDVGTPFDFQEQARFYIPTDLPHPSKEKVAWSSGSINRMRELIKRSGGGALLLFTSYKEMQTAYELLAPELPYTTMIQGQNGESNQKLAEKFRADKDSVLFGTNSFMTGVDIQGDSLRLLIVNKMPFPVPNDPLIEARCEIIENRGGNAFFDYSIPVMTLTLTQAVGRLIRSKTDRGVFAILDPRLDSMPYGRKVVSSLPDAPVINSLEAVEEMFS